MIEQAKKIGELTKDKIIIKSTSGTLMEVGEGLREFNKHKR